MTTVFGMELPDLQPSIKNPKIEFIKTSFRCFVPDSLSGTTRRTFLNSSRDVEHQSSDATNAYGFIRFLAELNSRDNIAEYVRISYKDNLEDVMLLLATHWRFLASRNPHLCTPDCVTKASPIFEECWKELIKQQPLRKQEVRISLSELHTIHKRDSQRDSQRLCMVIIGGTDNFILEEYKKNLFKKGLLKVASTTDAWIVTTGLNSGAVRILSEALEEYQQSCLELHSNRLRCLGIVPWRRVHNRQLLESNNYREPVDYWASLLSREKDTEILEPHHTHYLFVDNEDHSTAADKAVEFCAVLLARLSKRRTEGGWAIPIIGIVVNGGQDVIQAVFQFVQRQLPILVCSGSGRAADLIGLAHQLRLKYNEPTFERFHQDHIQLLKRKVADLLEVDKEFDSIIDTLTKIVSNPSLITVYDMTACQNLDVEIFQAVFNAMTCAIQDKLRLAMSWNRSDMAEQAIVRRGTPIDPDLVGSLMKDALLEDKSDFVKVFLANGVSMHKFLTLDRLHHLYYPRKVDIRQLQEGCSEHKNDQLFLSILVKVLRRRLGTFTDSIYELDTLSVHENSVKWNEAKSLEFRFPFQELFLWALLTRRQSIALLAWEQSQNPVCLALIACTLYHSLSESLPRYDLEGRRQYNKWIDNFESLSVGVLEECQKRDPELTQVMLESKTPIWGGFNCLELAAIGDRKEFCSTSAYQNALTSIWSNGIQTRKRYLLLATFCPLMLLASGRYFEFRSPPSSNIASRKQEQYSHAQYSKGDETRVKNQTASLSCFKKCVLFYTAPMTKCLLSSIMHIAFLLFFSYTLLFRMRSSSITTEEAIVMGYFVCFLVDVLRRIILLSRSNLGLMRYFQLYGWFQLDVVIVLVAAIAMNLRIGLSDTFQVAKPVYAITLVLCYTRVFALYGAIPVLGPKIVMIQRMLKELGLFCLIFVVILIAYGVSVHAVLYPRRNVFDWTALRDVVYYPYWNLYGELHLDYAQGEKSNCTENSNDPNCPQFNYLAPLMLAFYMLLAGILLVNLLIAIFSNVFQEVEQMSIQLWKHNRYALVITYKMATVLPVPFSIFETMGEFLKYFCRARTQRSTASTRIGFVDPNQEPMLQGSIPLDSTHTDATTDDLIRRLEMACTKSYLQSKELSMRQQTDPTVSTINHRIDSLRSELQDFTQMFTWRSQSDQNATTQTGTECTNNYTTVAFPPSYKTIEDKK